jgi:hypothetical protein
MDREVVWSLLATADLESIVEHMYKHSKAAHSANGCSCGCAVFQPANAPLVFNSIKAGEEIMHQIEAVRRRRVVSAD